MSSNPPSDARVIPLCPRLLSFEASLTPEQLAQDEWMDAKSFDINRLTMLATLMRSGQQLFEGFLNDKEGVALEATVTSILDYQAHLQQALQMSKSAVERLLLVSHTLFQRCEKPQNRKK